MSLWNWCDVFKAWALIFYMEPIIVFCTVPNESVGETIAKTLTGRNLAACVNISPQIRSIYMWKGKIEDEREFLLIIKSQRVVFKEVVSCIRENHPYEVPEIIAVPVIEGFSDYLKWIEENTTKKG